MKADVDKYGDLRSYYESGWTTITFSGAVICNINDRVTCEGFMSTMIEHINWWEYSNWNYSNDDIMRIIGYLDDCNFNDNIPKKKDFDKWQLTSALKNI